MHQHLAAFTGTEGVLFIGRAQEKTSLFRTEKRRDAEGRAYPWIVKTTGVVNHFYVYAVDDDFGPFFLKFCSYFPYNGRLCVNGHEWAKRQATKDGIAFTALDNGFAEVADPLALQAICDRLGPAQIQALVDKWLAILPGAFTEADHDAGYRYEISVLQAEFSLTQVLDQPVSGRVFFEQVIRNNLDAGRPDRIGLVFDRRIMSKGRCPTPGHFRTRVITEGVTPSVYIDYKHTADWVGCAARCLRAGPFPRSLPPNPVGIFRCARLSSDLRRKCGCGLPVVDEGMAGRADHEGLAPLSSHEFHPFRAAWS